MRLQVFLSKSGVCSRRKAKSLIEFGKVLVNGEKIFKAAEQVDPDKDKILFNGKRIKLKKHVYVLFNKPEGVITTKKDAFADKTVMDFLPSRLQHVYPVGRLDKNSSGLLLLTNDGELTLKLTHPRYETKKVYVVEVNKEIKKKDFYLLKKGVCVEGVKLVPFRVKILTLHKLEITLKEGKKRQIRRMLRCLGFKAKKLKRIKEDFLRLGKLLPGEYRFLTDKDIKKIKMK